MIQRDIMGRVIFAVVAVCVISVAVVLLYGGDDTSPEPSPEPSHTLASKGAGREASANEQIAENGRAKMGVKNARETVAVIEVETQAETEAETETVEVEVAEVKVEAVVWDDDAVMIAKTIGVEAPYCSTMEQAAVAWCILNRVDDPRFPATVRENVTPTSPRQFAYYPDTPLRDDLYALALDVLGRWEREKNGEIDVGRVLPSEYLYFWGDGKHNHFRINESDQVYWDWSWEDPYE